jgi:DNA-binding transcriptional LysR family regulator
MRTRSATTAAALASAGLGVALVPTSALIAAAPGAVRHLKPELTREVVALVGAPADALASEFVASLQKRGLSMSAEAARKLAAIWQPRRRR